jgi:hypothetical protein
LGSISKSQVSSLCEELDERLHAFIGRPIEGDRPISGSMGELPALHAGRVFGNGRGDGGDRRCHGSRGQRPREVLFATGRRGGRVAGGWHRRPPSVGLRPYNPPPLDRAR